MNNPLTLGADLDGALVQLPLDALRRHVLALGSSGSGKTVFCKVVVEECIRKRLPVIAVDPQGDIVSMALAEDAQALRELGVSPEIAEQFHERVDLKIWTPGSTIGIPLSLAPNLSSPSANASMEDKLRSFGAMGHALASIISDDSETTSLVFSMILEYADTHGLVCDTLADMLGFLRDAPRPLVRTLAPIVDERARLRIYKSLNLKTLGPNRLLFDLGRPIDVTELLGLYDDDASPTLTGKTRLSIIYLNTLTTEDDKQTFIAQLCSAIYKWMLGLSGADMWALAYFDEIASLMPPVRNPPAKQALMMLLRQARKYGVGCLLATQSPGDIDYKALGQIGTLAIGRILGERALGKVETLIRAQPAFASNADEIVEQLPAMGKGEFILMNPDELSGPVETKVRWLSSKHMTVPEDKVETLVTDGDRENLGGVSCMGEI